MDDQNLAGHAALGKWYSSHSATCVNKRAGRQVQYEPPLARFGRSVAFWSVSALGVACMSTLCFIPLARPLCPFRYTTTTIQRHLFRSCSKLTRDHPRPLSLSLSPSLPLSLSHSTWPWQWSHSIAECGHSHRFNHEPPRAHLPITQCLIISQPSPTLAMNRSNQLHLQHDLPPNFAIAPHHHLPHPMPSTKSSSIAGKAKR